MDTPTQESQQEFFPNFVKPSERKLEPRVAGVGRTQKPILLTTTLEQILLACIVMILVLCGVFFLGILRGKSLVGSGVLSRPAPAVAAVRAPMPVRAAAVAPAAPASSGPVRALTAAPAAPAPAAPSGSAALTPAKRLYTIQVVTHKKRSYAEAEMAAMAKAGFKGKILESDGYFVVCVGQYAAKDEAKKDLSLLKAKYPDCFLRRL